MADTDLVRMTALYGHKRLNPELCVRLAIADEPIAPVPPLWRMLLPELIAVLAAAAVVLVRHF